MSDLLRVIGFLLRPSEDAPSTRGLLFLVLVTSTVSGAASTGVLALVHRAIGGFEQLDRSLVWVFLALCLAVPAIRFVSQYLLLRLAQTTMLDLRMRLTRQILAAPLRRLEGIGSARVLATLMEDTSVLRELLTNLPILAMNAMTVVGCLAYLGWLSWPLLLVVLAYVLVGALSYQLAVRRGARYFQLVRDGMDRLMRDYRGLTEGIKELKLHGERRGSFVRGLLDSTVRLQRDTTIGYTIFSAAGGWSQVLTFLLLAALIFPPLPQLALSRETLSGAVLLLLFIRGPIDALLGTTASFSRANIAVRKIKDLGLSLGGEPASRALPAAAEGREGWRSLELAGVTHSYHVEREEREFVLGPLDLAFRPGEIVFVVGGNGSGKTTLAKLLLGLYAPDAGEVRFDGTRVTDENRERYFEHFTAVFSDFHLFESLLGMEGEGGPEIDERARGYLAKLHLDHKVRVEKGALSTLDLSQGQRKRLALLTAYMEDRPIYLFDEWAADQDPYFKEVFYLELLPELKARKKTVIVISHDDRYYPLADRLVKLDYGKVVYDGSADGYLAAMGERRFPWTRTAPEL